MIVRKDVVKLVKVMLEELSPFDEPAAMLAVPNNDVKPVESYIQSTLDKSFDDILLFMPLYVIQKTFTDYASVSPSPTITLKDGVGYCPVPADFLRLYAFTFSEWSRTVTTHITPENANAYALQRNKYTRGKFEKPVVAINNGKFEFYSLKAVPTAGTFTMKYIPKTEKNKGAFEKGLVDYLVLQNAIDVLNIFEQHDKAKELSAELYNKIKAITL